MKYAWIAILSTLIFYMGCNDPNVSTDQSSPEMQDEAPDLGGVEQIDETAPQWATDAQIMIQVLSASQI